MRQGKLVEMLGRFPAEQITAFLAKDPVLVRATEDAEWAQVLAEAKEYIRSEAEAAALEPEAAPPKVVGLRTPGRAYKRAGCVVRCGTVLLG